MKILDRYISNELIPPFFFGIAIFTLLFLSVDMLFRIAKMIIEDKGGIFTAIKYLLNNLPSILVFTFPMSILLATLMAFGRISSDAELIALKAGGISLYRIAQPALILSLIITLISFIFNEKISPEATYRANNILIKQLEGEEAQVRENLALKEITSDGLERVTFTRHFNSKEGLMNGITIQDFKGDHLIRCIFAKTAIWQEERWILKDGNIYNFSKNLPGEIQYGTHFQTFQMPLNNSPIEIENRERRPEEMNLKQLNEKINLIGKISLTSKELNKQVNALKVYYHQKFSIPFACFVFGLFGIPLALRPHRTSTSIGLGLSIVFIFFYYIIMSIGRALGENGIITSALASWLPNLIFLILGIGMLYKSGQN
ncbi:MAG: LptF/LptG family permease [Armatimonadetes bacterium]|nr:LptF/LptG family permease [Armatimonadota bacterium]